MNRFSKYILDRLTTREIFAYIAERYDMPRFEQFPALSKKWNWEAFEKISFQEYQESKYQETMSVIMDRLEECRITAGSLEPEKELKIYKSFRKILSLDLSYSSLATFLYKDDPFDEVHAHLLTGYYDEQGSYVRISPKKDEDAIIDIKGKYLIDCPTRTDKYYEHLFRETELDPALIAKGLPIYCPSLDLVVIGSDNHHRIAEAYINRESCRTPVLILDDENAYKCTYTDGAKWISKARNLKYADTGHHLLAIIFTLRQRELELEEKIM